MTANNTKEPHPGVHFDVYNKIYMSFSFTEATWTFLTNFVVIVASTKFSTAEKPAGELMFF